MVITSSQTSASCALEYLSNHSTYEFVRRASRYPIALGLEMYD